MTHDDAHTSGGDSTATSYDNGAMPYRVARPAPPPAHSDDDSLDRLFSSDHAARVQAAAVRNQLPQGFGERSFKRLLRGCLDRFKNQRR